MNFLHDDFLLTTPIARTLYHDIARDLPIIDFHNHLSPSDIAQDRRFDNITQVWLDGDHYKWRAMRTNGISEDLVSGKGRERERFNAWAATVPRTVRNPLHVWTHLELRRYFGITELLDSHSAERIWHATRERLQGDLSTRTLLTQQRVRVVCTTDDPAETLLDHAHYAAEKAAGRAPQSLSLYPTFRPDRAFAVDRPAVLNAWCDRLAKTAQIDISSANDLIQALAQRHAEFHRVGGRLSDYGLELVPAAPCTDAQAHAIFQDARSGISATPEKYAQFGTWLLAHLARLDAAAGWTMQLHMGAIRNLNTRLMNRLGADAGCDSIGDGALAKSLAWFLDHVDQQGQLPKTIIYNINAADNYLCAAMAGCFQDGITPGKIQYGPAWWFLDQEDGIRQQLEVVSQLGLISCFVGMLTDSRSFLSFPRHELFRRVLCRMLGEDVAVGRVPDDMNSLRTLVSDVCYGNAARHFSFPESNL
jgi:glucuronate isomerase